jgi:Uma2 family endonuclease
MNVNSTLLTAEEYARTPDDGRSELVRGRVVALTFPPPRHGQVCSQASRLICDAVEDHGHLVVNIGIVTRRDPDTVRGADVVYYSFDRVAKGPLPWEYLAVPPELILEVLAPDDRGRDVLERSLEFLDTGVNHVCILDPATATIQIHTADHPPRLLTADDEFALPEVLGQFRVPVRRFFE